MIIYILLFAPVKHLKIVNILLLISHVMSQNDEETTTSLGESNTMEADNTEPHSTTQAESKTQDSNNMGTENYQQESTTRLTTHLDTTSNSEQQTSTASNMPSEIETKTDDITTLINSETDTETKSMAPPAETSEMYPDVPTTNANTQDTNANDASTTEIIGTTEAHNTDEPTQSSGPIDFTTITEIDDIDTFCSTKNQTTKFFPHPKNCSQYFICHNSQATIFNCSLGYHFDKTHHSCVTFRRPCNSITLNQNSDQDKKHGFQSDNMSCDKYIKFIIDTPEIIECKPGEHFDINKKVCIS